jgi:ADP-ribose pyrophosphatase
MAPGFRHLEDREVASLDRIRVYRSRFEAPDGTTFERDVVRNHAVVAVVPVLEDGQTVVLVRQYRGPLDRAIEEIPAGLCDVADEPPEQTARRELIEEVGLVPGHLELLAAFHPSPGFSDQFVRVYLATDLTQVAPDRQGVEEAHMEVTTLSLAELDDAIAAGRLSDAKTLIGLLRARDHLHPGR